MGSGNFLVLLGIFGTFLSRWARRGNFSKLGINSVWGLGILIPHFPHFLIIHQYGECAYMR